MFKRRKIHWRGTTWFWKILSQSTLSQTMRACSGANSQAVGGQPFAKEVKHVTCGSSNHLSRNSTSLDWRGRTRTKWKNAVRPLGFYQQEKGWHSHSALNMCKCYRKKRMTPRAVQRLVATATMGLKDRGVASPPHFQRAGPLLHSTQQDQPHRHSQPLLLPSLCLWSHFQ